MESKKISKSSVPLLLRDAPDSALIGLASRGDREAFDEIDRRYRPKLCRFLQRHASGTTLAEELAQRTLIKAFVSLETLKKRDRFDGWLYQIAFRLAADEARKPSYTKQLDELRTRKLIDYRSEVRETFDVDADGGVWTLARRILSANEYSAVWLKYVDGYKVDSIAKIMQHSRISVRVLLFRARKKLLEALQDDENNGVS